MCAAASHGTQGAPLLPFPDGYPDLLEHVGQSVYRQLLSRAVDAQQAASIAFDVTETLRMELGGTQHYVPRGVGYALSQRDAQIFAQFNGRNYQELAQQYQLSEMQVRTIIKRGLARVRAARQNDLF